LDVVLLVQILVEDLAVGWQEQQGESVDDNKEMALLESHQEQSGVQKADLLEALCTRHHQDDYLQGDHAKNHNSDDEY
jgi:hypothetical protein